jgi:hypothetical protein
VTDISAAPPGTYAISVPLNTSGVEKIEVAAEDENMDMCNCATGLTGQVLGCPNIVPCVAVPSAPTT